MITFVVLKDTQEAKWIHEAQTFHKKYLTNMMNVDIKMKSNQPIS